MAGRSEWAGWKARCSAHRAWQAGHFFAPPLQTPHEAKAEQAERWRPSRRRPQNPGRPAGSPGPAQARAPAPLSSECGVSGASVGRRERGPGRSQLEPLRGGGVAAPLPARGGRGAGPGFDSCWPGGRAVRPGAPSRLQGCRSWEGKPWLHAAFHLRDSGGATSRPAFKLPARVSGERNAGPDRDEEQKPSEKLFTASPGVARTPQRSLLRNLQPKFTLLAFFSSII